MLDFNNTTEPLPYLCASSFEVCLHYVGSLHLQEHLYMLDSVQKFACKVCLKQWDVDYDSMLHLLGISHGSLHVSCF